MMCTDKFKMLKKGGKCEISDTQDLLATYVQRIVVYLNLPTCPIIYYS